MDKHEHMPDISQKVLERIDREKVAPKPKWQFFLQEGGVWVLGAAATFCGAIAVSATLFVFVTAPLRYQPATHESIIQFWADFLPLLWIIVFVAFIFVTDYVIRKTKRGYRYNIVVLTVSSALLSVVLGYLGFLIGLGEFLESRVSPSIPFHTSVGDATRKAFLQPDRGLLVGMVEPGDTVILRTPTGMVWDLDLAELSDSDRSLFATKTVVSVIGTSTSDSLFVVCMVIPLEQLPSEVAQDSLLENERNSTSTRTSICKGVRPYERLQAKLNLRYEHQ